MILELFFFFLNCFLTCLLKKSELLHEEISSESSYQDCLCGPGMSLSFCGCVWLSISPLQPSAWNLYAVSPACLFSSDLPRPLSSGSPYRVAKEFVSRLI